MKVMYIPSTSDEVILIGWSLLLLIVLQRPWRVHILLLHWYVNNIDESYVLCCNISFSS